MTPPGLDPLAALAQLWAKVDAFEARVEARMPGERACAEGCDDCCAPGLTVTTIEAEAIAAFVERAGDDARARVRGALASARADRCAALDARGACSIYEARPLVCRSHGLPLRIVGGERRLPLLDACPKNFVGRDLGSIERACVLDQATLSTMLGAIDAAFADASSLDRGLRAPLAELLADLLTELPNERLARS
jgi:Fe-S-cluster containining protein